MKKYKEINRRFQRIIRDPISFSDAIDKLRSFGYNENDISSYIIHHKTLGRFFNF